MAVKSIRKTIRVPQSILDAIKKLEEQMGIRIKKSHLFRDAFLEFRDKIAGVLPTKEENKMIGIALPKELIASMDTTYLSVDEQLVRAVKLYLKEKLLTA